MGWLEPGLVITLPRSLCMLLGLFAGIGLYLAFVNRVLSFLKDGVIKSTSLPLTFTIIVGGMVSLVYLSWPSLLAATPIFIIAVFSLGEFRLHRYRRRYNGSPPVSRQGKEASLLRPNTTTDLQVTRFELILPWWDGGSLRVAHLSDLHVNDHIPLDYYRDAVEQVNQTHPDLIFITGDFISDERFIPLLPEILLPLSSPLGVFAILGNHDHWADADQVSEVVRDAGVHLLCDGWQRVPNRLKNDIFLLGCEAPWRDDDCAPSIPDEKTLSLILAHSGDNIFNLSRLGATAVFSGHYHAGQFQLPGLGPFVVPSSYGRLFHHGHYLVNGTHLFVSAGVGAASPPYRLYCPPDIFVVDFTGSANPNASDG